MAPPSPGGGARAPGVMRSTRVGRGLHSFRFQFNLSSYVHRVTQIHPERVLELLKLSSDVNECKPLHAGAYPRTVAAGAARAVERRALLCQSVSRRRSRQQVDIRLPLTSLRLHPPAAARSQQGGSYPAATHRGCKDMASSSSSSSSASPS